VATPISLDLAKRIWGWSPHSDGQSDFLLCPAKIKTAACGRRWGKSESMAIDIALYMLEHPNTIQMLIAPTDDQTTIIFDEVKDRLLAIKALKPVVKESPFRSIQFRDRQSGKYATTLLARTASSDGKGIRGRKAHRVIVDEAAYVPDDVMQSVVTPLLADFNGDMVLISTPAGRNHFWSSFQLGVDELQTRYKSFQFPSEQNPYLSREYLDNERLNKPDRVWRVEYLAEFADAEGLVFRNVPACCSGDWEPPQHRRLYAAGLDLARYNDFTVLTIIDRATRRVVYQDRFNLISWDLQVARIVSMLKRYNDCPVLVEVNNVGDVVLEKLQQAQARATGFETTASSKPDLIDALAVAFETHSLTLPDRDKCAVMVNELQSYAYSKSAAGRISMSAPDGMHDDTVISLALAWRLAHCVPGMGAAGPARVYGDGRQSMEQPVQKLLETTKPVTSRRSGAVAVNSRIPAYTPR